MVDGAYLEKLTHRIDDLERRNRRSRTGMFAFALIAALPWIFAATQQKPLPGIVKARELQIMVGDSIFYTIKATTVRHGARVDRAIGFFSDGDRRDFTVIAGPAGGDIHVYNSSDRVIATMRADSIGGTMSLSKGDSANDLMLYAGTAVVGGQLSIYNADGKAATSIYVRPDSAGEIAVRNASGVWRGGIWASQTGGQLGLRNGDGKDVFSVAANKWGGGQVSVSNSGGTPVAWVFSNEDATGSMQVGSGNGSYSAAMVSMSDRSGKIDITNGASIPVAAIGVGSNGNALISAAAADGKGVFQAGADDNGGYASIMNLSHVESGGLALQSSGQPIFRLIDPVSKTTIVDLFGGDSGGRLQLYARSGAVTHAVPER